MTSSETVGRAPAEPRSSAGGAGDGGGAGAPGSFTPATDLLKRQAARHGSRPALRWHERGSWRSMSWSEYGRAVDEVAAALVALGVAPGERVAILSGNRREWHLADLGILTAGAVTVPVYQTNSSSQVAYVLAHSSARYCFVEDGAQLAKVLLRRDELPALQGVVVFEPGGGYDDSFVRTFDSLRDEGARALDRDPSTVDERRDSITVEDVATIVYTSGTTGRPKGAMLTHGNLVSTMHSVTAVVPVGPDDRFLSFLPLSHIAERIVSDFGHLVSGGETWFAQSLASVPDDLKACRPTIFFAVPRVWEKFQEAVLAKVAASPKPLAAAIERYLDLARRDHESPGSLATAESVQLAALERVIGRRIRSEMGLDEARVLVSGAAPIHPDLLRWFAALGLRIGEAYGQTENCGVTAISPPGGIKLGTVGRPAPGVEVRIAADGEILVRGGNVTIGYLDDTGATAELIDGEGWMHTGDLGRLDEDGFLAITGRKKDLIINAAGKNISPTEIETALGFEPLISQAVVVGDRRPYLVALLSLDADQVADWASRHDKLGSPEALRDDPDLLEEVQAAVDRVNERHARVEQIKRWRLLPHDLSVEEGELTPTLKVKRHVVTEKFADLIEQLYAS